MVNKPLFFLAPMDDVTDTVFRRIVSDCAAPDYTMTEFVNVDGLCSPGRERLIRKLDTSQDKTPVIAQIWGKKPENYKTIAYEISQGILHDPEYEQWLTRELGSNEALMSSKENRECGTGSTVPEIRMQLAQRFVETVRSDDSFAGVQVNGSKFSGIDINFGCPAKSEIKAGCCSALQQLELRPEAAAMIEATLEGAGDFPVSFKTRLGFGEIDYTWHEFLLGYKPWILTVHVRTTKEMSKVPAHWDAIQPILELRDKISPETKIIMNGDIMNRKHGEEIIQKYGVDGVMIGRGVFHDPYTFAQTTHQPTCQLAQPAEPLASSDSAPVSSAMLTSTYGNTSRSASRREQAHNLEVGRLCECPSVWDEIYQSERIQHFRRHVELHIKQWPDNMKPFNPLKKFAKVYISDFPGAAELRAKIMAVDTADEALKLV